MLGALMMAATAALATGRLLDEPSPPRPEARLRHETLAVTTRALRGSTRLLDRDLALRRVGLRAEEAGAQEASAELEPPPDEAHLAVLRRWERALKWSTAGALVVTATLGTMAAINQPTAFGDGRCQTGTPVLGTYGCDRGLSTLHGASGVLSATLYTANGVLALSIPGPIGNVTPREQPWHRGLTYVHLGGIVLQPILGLVAAFPEVIGVRNTAPTDPFPRNVRTIHVGLGYLTAAAYIATLVLEQ
jgi:hypothetical protein